MYIISFGASSFTSSANESEMVKAATTTTTTTTAVLMSQLKRQKKLQKVWSLILTIDVPQGLHFPKSIIFNTHIAWQSINNYKCEISMPNTASSLSNPLRQTQLSPDCCSKYYPGFLNSAVHLSFSLFSFHLVCCLPSLFKIFFFFFLQDKHSLNNFYIFFFNCLTWISTNCLIRRGDLK